MNSVTVVMTILEMKEYVLKKCPQFVGAKHKCHGLAAKCEERGIRYKAVVELRAKRSIRPTRDCMTAEACPECPYFLSCQTSHIERSGCHHGCNGFPVSDHLIQFPASNDGPCTVLTIPPGIKCPSSRERVASCPACVERIIREDIATHCWRPLSKRVSDLSSILKVLLVCPPRDGIERDVCLGHVNSSRVHPWRVIADGWFQEECP